MSNGSDALTMDLAEINDTYNHTIPLSFPSSDFSSGLWCVHWEGDTAKIKQLYQPLLDWCSLPAQQQQGIHCSAYAHVAWNQSSYDPHAHLWDNASFIPKHWVGNMPWINSHQADREISTSLVGSLSKYIPASACSGDNETERDMLVDGILRIERILQNISAPTTGDVFIGTTGLTGDKSQYGMPPDIVARFKKTALQPVLLQAPAFWLIMLNIPSLPQLPPSSRVLESLWPKLQKYAVRSERDPLWPTCARGAAGDEDQAVQCMDGWSARLPRLRAQVDKMREILWEVLPNQRDGKAYSGSYW